MRGLLIIFLLFMPLISIAFYLLMWKYSTRTETASQHQMSYRTRFRNRDKVLYYANRFKNNFTKLGNQMKAINSPDERRKMIGDFAKKYVLLVHFYML
ncbi:hypothetical protein Ciccas_005336 [Cichlidogyrus casuarinus]|uniref:Uncharacterized protein n=1 Tax=Cichlidogyrus casuarinus TaxID=1844966 RepID=A0ABD2Q905_9PLAT